MKKLRQPDRKLLRVLACCSSTSASMLLVRFYNHATFFVLSPAEKPLRPKQLKCENVFGKPVQELTVWWTGPQVDVTYKLFIGRIPEGQLLCKLNYTMPLCTQTSRYKNELLSCHLGKEVLGWLFLWNELTHITHCSGGQYGLIWIRCDVFCAQVVAQNAFGPTYSEYVSKWNLLNKGKIFLMAAKG